MSITFHQMCRAGFESRMARTGCDEDDLAQQLNDHFGSTVTGDDTRRMHNDGYSSHFLDMMAETSGRSTLSLIAQSMQTFLPGPHIACPSCMCGITSDERQDIAARYLYNGEADAGEALNEIRTSRGGVQALPCDCAPSLP